VFIPLAYWWAGALTGSFTGVPQVGALPALTAVMYCFEGQVPVPALGGKDVGVQDVPFHCRT